MQTFFRCRLGKKGRLTKEPLLTLSNTVTLNHIKKDNAFGQPGPVHRLESFDRVGLSETVVLSVQPHDPSTSHNERVTYSLESLTIPEISRPIACRSVLTATQDVPYIQLAGDGVDRLSLGWM